MSTLIGTISLSECTLGHFDARQRLTLYYSAMIGEPGAGLGVEARKRVTIGVELAAKPQLLLFLDEPTSGIIPLSYVLSVHATYCTVIFFSFFLANRLGRVRPINRYDNVVDMAEFMTYHPDKALTTSFVS